jgi:cysteine desulfurase
VSAPRSVYLDYAATTPVDPRVVAAMSACLGVDGDFGNASSSHAFGRTAAARIARARALVASLIGAATDDIVFTSGATESDNLAILGVARANADRGRHLVTSRTEHKAVLDPCRRLEKEGFSLTYLTPERSGLIPAAAVAAALRPDTQLVSIMGVNNETGVLQDLAAIGAVCRARGVAFHSDLAQAAGKVPLDVARLPLDIASFTAHKLYGPKGIGALYVRRAAHHLVQPLMFGGGQEAGLRPGTLATHQIVGFGAACELAAREFAPEGARLTALRERLWRTLAELPGTHLNGAAAPRVPGIINVSFEGVEGESLVAGLPELAISTGAACNSTSPEASYVLRALGRDARLAGSSLRFSLGRYTSEAEVDLAASVVRRELERLRALSPAAGSAAAQSAWAGGVAAGEALVSGEAGGPEQETWVRFHLLVAGDTVKDARFQALGCPHTLDVAGWLCGELRGRKRTALVPGSPGDWAAARAVPVEKLGRLLLVEDALRACQGLWASGARQAPKR